MNMTFKFSNSLFDGTFVSFYLQSRNISTKIYIESTQNLNAYFCFNIICPFLFCKKYIDVKEINYFVKSIFFVGITKDKMQIHVMEYLKNDCSDPAVVLKLGQNLIQNTKTQVLTAY